MCITTRLNTQIVKKTCFTIREIFIGHYSAPEAFTKVHYIESSDRGIPQVNTRHMHGFRCLITYSFYKTTKRGTRILG